MPNINSPSGGLKYSSIPTRQTNGSPSASPTPSTTPTQPRIASIARQARRSPVASTPRSPRTASATCVRNSALSGSASALSSTSASNRPPTS